MAPKLSIGTVNYNSADFLELGLRACETLTANDFEFLICDNGSSWRERRRIRMFAANRDHVSIFWRQQEGEPSEAHGRALNRLVSEMSGEYGVFLDADATFLYDEWDKHLISRLDETTKVAGTPPVPNPNKPTDFPCVYATLFELQSFRELGVDMRPEDPSIGHDTGWEMREKYLDAGYDAINLETRSTREFSDGPLGDVICAEYYLDGVDGIFASHFGRGSTLGAAKYVRWLPLVPVVGTIPKKLAGIREKRRWIALCESIIESQS